MGMSFLKQDRPGKVKEIYRALKRDHPGMPAEMKARISARQGKPGSQKQGPPYKGPITPWKEKIAMISWDSYFDEMQKIAAVPGSIGGTQTTPAKASPMPVRTARGGAPLPLSSKKFTPNVKLPPAARPSPMPPKTYAQRDPKRPGRARTFTQSQAAAAPPAARLSMRAGGKYRVGAAEAAAGQARAAQKARQVARGTFAFGSPSSRKVRRFGQPDTTQAILDARAVMAKAPRMGDTGTYYTRQTVVPPTLQRK